MKLPRVRNINELIELVEEIGFLPFFTGELSGFSVMSVTSGMPWWSGDPERDPWNWRISLARGHKLVYAKLFCGKTGFISLEWYPVLVNYRRNGYDFDARYEAGYASRRSKLIIDMLQGNSLPSFEIKRRFAEAGEKGFEGALSALEMQTYLTVSDFAQKRNKLGEPYGWHAGILSEPETVFGEELVRSRYSDDPRDSLQTLVTRLGEYVEGISDGDLRRFLK